MCARLSCDRGGLSLQVDGDDGEDAAAPAVRKKKKKKIGEMHQNADSLQIGFGEGEAEDNSDDEYEYEESTYSPPPPDDNEVAWVSNPHPSLWPPEPRPQLDISEVRVFRLLMCPTLILPFGVHMKTLIAQQMNKWRFLLF